MAREYTGCFARRRREQIVVRADYTLQSKELDVSHSLRNCIFAAALAMLLVACAGTDQTVVAGEEQPLQKCGFDETYSCIERMGLATRCFCADKDTLRELLEPTIK